MAPINDNFVDATVITGASGTVAWTTVGATIEAGEYGAASGDKSVWLAWVAPGSGLTTISITSPVDHTVDVLKTFSGSGTNLVAEAYFDAPDSWTAVSGTTYYFEIYNFGHVAASSGTVTWNLVVTTTRTVADSAPASDGGLVGNQMPNVTAWIQAADLVQQFDADSVITPYVRAYFSSSIGGPAPYTDAACRTCSWEHARRVHEISFAWWGPGGSSVWNGGPGTCPVFTPDTSWHGLSNGNTAVGFVKSGGNTGGPEIDCTMYYSYWRYAAIARTWSTTLTKFTSHLQENPLTLNPNGRS